MSFRNNSPLRRKCKSCHFHEITNVQRDYKEYDSFKNRRKIYNFFKRYNLTTLFLALKMKKIFTFFISVKNKIHLLLIINVCHFGTKSTMLTGI